MGGARAISRTFRELEAMISGVLTVLSANALGALRGSRVTCLLSGDCPHDGRFDMAENYMFSAPRKQGLSTGVVYLPLQVRCVLWTRFAFVVLSQGRAEGPWFKIENDNQAVPMQPNVLCAFRANNFGSSGIMLTNRTNAQTNLDEPIFT
jgi:hypothetical protein